MKGKEHAAEWLAAGEGLPVEDAVQAMVEAMDAAIRRQVLEDALAKVGRQINEGEPADAVGFPMRVEGQLVNIPRGVAVEMWPLLWHFAEFGRLAK